MQNGEQKLFSYYWYNIPELKIIHNIFMLLIFPFWSLVFTLHSLIWHIT